MKKGNRKVKQNRRGRLIACVIYLLLVLLFLIGMNFVLRWMEGWLTDYEAAQPKVKSQQVFEMLFDQPDWAQLYEMAGLEDTIYESAAQYAAFMENKVQDKKLFYYETSAGLSGDYKYIVRMEDEKVAEFTLTAEKHETTDIPDWQLGTVKLFPVYNEAVTVYTGLERTVYINGVELEQTHVIRTAHTVAEEYIPEELDGQRRVWWYAEGFMIPPQVTVTDSQGQAVELTYDETAGVYTELFTEPVIPEADRIWLHEAATIYCRYMIGDISHYYMRAYIDDREPIFEKITRGSKWMQYYTAYRLAEPIFANYYSYSDSLYSVRLTMSMYLTRPDGTEKEYPLDSTFLVHKRPDGNWRVLDILNIDFQSFVTQVRLTYIQNGEIIQTDMVGSSATRLTPPAVTAPEGKVFSGWYILEKDEKGNATYSLAFKPEEDGTVKLTWEIGEEPMTLYALFENA